MKFLFRSLFFHFICILIFATLYYNFSYDYNNSRDVVNTTILDFLLLSTTIQAGVGISGFYPINAAGKLLMTLQQILMLSNNVFTLYLFTL
jgi:multisubunit Na+/H+ antiporter MnhB subunit